MDDSESSKFIRHSSSYSEGDYMEEKLLLRSQEYSDDNVPIAGPSSSRPTSQVRITIEHSEGNATQDEVSEISDEHIQEQNILGDRRSPTSLRSRRSFRTAGSTPPSRRKSRSPTFRKSPTSSHRSASSINSKLSADEQRKHKKSSKKKYLDKKPDDEKEETSQNKRTSNEPNKNDQEKGGEKKSPKNEDLNKNTDNEKNETLENENDQKERDETEDNKETPARKIKRKSLKKYVHERTIAQVEHITTVVEKFPALKENPKRSKLCHLLGITQMWLLIVLYCASTAFSYFIPIWEKSNIEFVPREYDLTGARCGYVCEEFEEHCMCMNSNETYLLTEEDVNNFVEVLHSIIAVEGCQKLNHLGMVTNFEEGRPIIQRSIIYDDLRRKFSYSQERAKVIVDLCETLFYSFHSGVVMSRVKGFIYLNDSLMKYCGYTFDFYGDALKFILLLFCSYVSHLPFRLITDNYIRPKLTKKIYDCVETQEPL